MSKGRIDILKKRVANPLCADQLERLVPYRVVDIRDKDEGELAVDDIIVKLPSSVGGYYLLNCTRQVVMMTTRGCDFNGRFRALRALHIESIRLTYDFEQRPE